MQPIDVDSLNKHELRAAVKAARHENEGLRESVARLLRQANPPPAGRAPHHPDDFVPAGWAERHGVAIPRADGVFESAAAWVRVKHGVIVAGGLRSRSILSLAVSLDLLDQGAEHHGSLYRDWKAAFLSRLDPGTSGEGGIDNPDGWSKEDRYSKLLRRVDQDNLAAVDCMVAARPKARHLAAFQGNQGAFVTAFRTVASAMAAITREAADALDRVKGQ